MKLLQSLLLLLVFTFTGTAMAQTDSSYTLGSGDLLRVSVFGEPDLSIEQIRLNDAGTFSYPFLGSINAKGKTAKQVEAQIANGLRGDYLIDPKVTVSILEYREFFVNGEVRNPGGYPFQPGMTLRKAVALAGGFSERASRSAFSIIHDNDPGRTPRKATLDTPVMPGDIITIDQSFF
ncbi:capsular biosynthesis protein [Zobellella taiwanensis]|uniref:Capsular biosynthesis protein n=2 Tax=Zobellella taiwanensis TaxID=347535 RepID=A0A2P7QQ82_9GAMM|nr:capsular biosynthesis protein [Zobellella taiwanensis]